ncbi:MAG: methyltransferase domain-containing protein [Candidatus Electrothrix sp. AW3_4]|nr:methyltransferase domain-containing protein [Candidatus Electrothrix gigas]
MSFFYGVSQEKIDFRTDAVSQYISRIASKDRILDIGGRNQQSKSNRRLRQLSTNPRSKIVSTDVVSDYKPDIVDDIASSNIESESFDSIYCSSILQFVTDCDAAIKNMYRILAKGGELYIYVPFFLRITGAIDGEKDLHRFTFIDLDRMLNSFSDYRLFVPDEKGYGGVLLELLTHSKITRFPVTHSFFSQLVNLILTVAIAAKYASNNIQRKYHNISFSQYKFYHTHLAVNKGICAWALK